MAQAYAPKVPFELVSPERLLFSADVDMVVIPGSEGDFGVLPGHTQFLSAIRPGVIEAHNGGTVSARIFIWGGFAEASPERCTVLADRAVPVEELKRGEIEGKLRDAREDLADAGDEAARAAAMREIALLEAMLAAAPA